MLVSSFKQTHPISPINFGYKFYGKMTLERKKITVILIGENHTDPSPIGLIRENIKKFHALGIKQIHCPEVPHDFSFQDDLESVNNWVELNNRTLQIEEFQSLLIKNDHLSQPYFMFEQIDKIREIFALKFPGMDKDRYPMYEQQLRRYLNLQATSLLNQQLLELQIPFQGIENSMEEHCAFINMTVDNDASILAHEEFRIDVMTRNLFKKGFPKIEETGGIMWVNVGNIHSPNLAASVHNHIYENSNLHKYSFTIIPTICFSPYTSDNLEEVCESIQETQRNFKNQKMVALFEKITIFPITDIIEKEKHHYESATFNEIAAQVKGFYHQPKE